MLSAFTARPLLELKQRDKFKIECVSIHGDKLFVGLSTGALRIYRVNHNSVPRSDEPATKRNTDESSPCASLSNIKSVELLREHEKFSKYAINQLGVIKEANLLLVLSNYQVSLYDLSNYELLEILAGTKGTHTFAVTSHIFRDESSQVPEIVSFLAVAVKKKVIVHEWRDSIHSESKKEFTLPAAIRSITWVSGNKLVAGTTSHYVVLNTDNSSTVDISGPGAIGGPNSNESSRFGGVGVSGLMGSLGPMPLVTKLPNDEVLLAKDVNSYFIDTQGDAIKRKQVPWSQAPDTIGFSYPYLLALYTSKGSLEIRNPETLTCLQTISISGIKVLCVPNSGVSLAHAGKGFAVASDRAVWRMDTLEYDAQIEALTAAGQWDEALSLLNILESALISQKLERIRKVKLLKAKNLFELKKFRQSFDLFTEVQAEPSRVIRLLPFEISGDEAIDESRSSASVSEKEGQVSQSISGLSNDTTSEIHSAQAKADSLSVIGSIRDSVKLSSNPEPEMKNESNLDEKDLKSAVVELISFLVETRTRIQGRLGFDGNLKHSEDRREPGDEYRPLLPQQQNEFDEQKNQLVESEETINVENLRQTAKLVDSTLFRCYMFARPQLAGPLFRLPNFIDAKVAEEKLTESKRFADLIDFFYGKSLHQKALQLLTSLGKGEMKGENVPEALRGPQRLVTYLQNLPSELIDLILRFIDWPMHTDPDLAMEVFIGFSNNSESLPRKRVLEYLQDINHLRAAQYLEFIIDEFGETSPDMHRCLIEFYVNKITSHDESSASKQLYQDKLLKFVRSSRHYEPWRVNPLLRKDDPHLYEARAVMLGRTGQHKQALEIYVFEMEDISKAENYCNEIWVEEQKHRTSRFSSDSTHRPKHDNTPSLSYNADADTPTPYLILLSLLLSPRPPRKTQLGPALDLLTRHGSRLPAASTLSLIPENIAVHEVENYFKARIRASKTTFNMARMTASLRKTLDDSADLSLKLGEDTPENVKGADCGRNRSVVVREASICKVCRKRFGGSAVKILSEGDVVHYGCAAR